jgi:hypothetical protein
MIVTFISGGMLMIQLPIFDDEGLRWLDQANCADSDIHDFFVDAGHVIGDDILEICRRCPVRKDCVDVAYNPRWNVTGGYFGGLSPGLRRELSKKQAHDFIDNDPPQLEDLDDEEIIYT